LNHVTEPGCNSADHAGEQKRAPAVSAGALEQASRLFKAIGDVPRLRLLALLAQGEACVTELAESEGESISTISQRLRVLRSENIVLRKRRGKHINYALADQHVIDLVFNALAHASEHLPKAPTTQEALK
jgi:ArsR family transcriptional regulator, lead/cadmium/zinc/bismuth-responsive transcriptional repressor